MPKGIVTVRIIGDAKSLQAALGKSRRMLGGFGGVVRNFGGLIGGLGFGAVVSKIAEYDRSMGTFGAVTRAGAAEMENVRTLAKDLGADMSLPGTSAADAAMAMTEMAKAGLSVSESMASAKGVLQLSAAAGVDNATAAGFAASALNAFGLSGQEAGRVADLLAASANASLGEITDMGLALNQSAAVFAQAKVPIEDATTAISLMAQAGIKGSDAGTSLKTMMLRLLAPASDKAKGAIEDLGVSIFNSQGQMRPMREIIGQFSTALGGLTDEQRAQRLQTIFGTDAIRAANIVLGAGVEQFDAMKVAVTEQGAAAQVAAGKQAGLGGALDGIGSAMETLIITFGEKFGDDIAGAINAVSGALVFLSDHFDTIAASLGPVLAGFAAFKVAMLVQTAVTTGFGLSAAAAWLAAAGPIPFLVAAVVMIGVALFSMRDKVGAALGKVRDFFVGVFNRVKGVVVGAVKFMLKLAKFHPLGWIITHAKDIWNVVVTAFTKIKDFGLRVFQSFGRGLSIIWDGIKALFVGGVNILITAINGLINGVNLAVRGLNILNPFADVPYIPNIPLLSFDRGGTVPGPLGAPQLAVVHGGERVLTRSEARGARGGGASVTVNLGPITIGSADRRSAQAFMEQIRRELGRELDRVLRAG